MKIKFIGKSDYNFTNGEIYQLIKIEQDDYYFNTWISNDNNKISFIPYATLDNFNENWEVVNE